MAISSQSVNFKTFKTNEGRICMDLGIYVWSVWNKEKKDITFDLNNNRVNVDDKSFEVVERPDRWIIKRDCKYCIFGCVDEWYNKVCVKLYEYDNSNVFYIYVNEQTQAHKYAALKKESF